MGGCRQSEWHKRLYAAPLAVGLVLAASGVVHSAILERIVATVNRRVILESEWDETVRFEALMNGRPLQDVTSEQRKQVLARLIEQTLIQEQMDAGSYPPASPEEVTQHLLKARSTVPAWKTDERWRAALQTYGLTQADVEERTAVQVNIQRYLDARFRPDLHIDRRAVDSYYRDQFLPELRRSGGADVPLKDVAPKIEELLTLQRLTELETQWVRALREQADVQVR